MRGGWRKSFTALLTLCLASMVMGDVSPSCQREWSEVTVIPPTEPALQFQLVDSFGTTTQNYGKWYQCQSLKNNSVPFAHLCLLSVPLETAMVNFGACVPRTCNSSDVVALAQTDTAFQFIIPLLATLNTTGATATCGDHAPQSWDGGAIAMLTVLSILGLVAVAGTALDLFQRNNIDGTQTAEDSDDLFERLMVESQAPTPEDQAGIKKALLAFSLLRNWAQLVDTAPRTGRGGERFPHLDGIRFLSMTWVIFGHTIFFMLISPGIVNITESVLPPDGAAAKQWAFQLVPSAEYAVDSFFYLSGFLVGRSLPRRIRSDTTLGEFASSLPLMIFLRFARLLPALSVVMFGYWSLLKYMGSGPVWYQVAASVEPCHKYWWTNLLFINTLVPWNNNFSNECMGWTWYLSVDTLLFYLVPPLIFLYTRSTKAGFALPLTLIASSIIAAGFTAWHNRLSMYPFDPNGSGGDYGDQYYTKFWFRAPPYLTGVVAALFLQSYAKGPHRRPPAMVSLFALTVACVLLGWTTFGGFSMYRTILGTWNRWQMSVWVAISRPLWGLGLCLLCLVCHFGHAGPIGYLLASPIWPPLSRLTFSAYLVHEVVISGVYYSQDHPYTYSAINAAILTTGIGTLSYCCAALVFPFVESPFANLVKLITPNPKGKR